MFSSAKPLLLSVSISGSLPGMRDIFLESNKRFISSTRVSSIGCCCCGFVICANACNACVRRSERAIILSIALRAVEVGVESIDCGCRMVGICGDGYNCDCEGGC